MNEADTNAIGAGLIGILVGLVPPVVGVPIDEPVVSLGLGGLTTFLLLLTVDGRRKYAYAGVILFFGLGNAYLHVPDLPPVYTKTPFVATLGIGFIAGGILAAREIGRRIVLRPARRVGLEEEVEAIYNAASAIVSIFLLITGYKAGSKAVKAVRHGTVGTLGTVSFYLNLIGVDVQFPFWFFVDGLDATFTTFAGCLMLGFFTLEAWHTTWYAAKKTASVGADAAQTAGAATAAAAGSAASSARSAAADVAERTPAVKANSPNVGWDRAEATSSPAGSSTAPEMEAEQMPDDSPIDDGTTVAPDSTKEQVAQVFRLLEEGRHRNEPWGRVTPAFVSLYTALDRDEAKTVLAEMADRGYVEEVAIDLYEVRSEHPR